MPGGVNSPVRAFRAVGGHPTFFHRAKGSYIYDVNEKRYIDYVLSWGAMLLGHGHEKVIEAIVAQLEYATSLGAPTKLEIDLAQRICSLIPGIESIRMVNSGTEATMSAIRLARGYTGRDKIIKFEGHYHGWWDAVLINSNPQPITALGHPNSPIRIPDSSGMTEESWMDTIVVPWNDLEALERAMALHGRDAACVVTEGVMSNMGVIAPAPGYLNRMQELCNEYGALFYLDETVTGFRVAAGGCAELYNLKPDLVTYGKALGGGVPMAAIGGSNEVMSGLEWGKVLHFGTHNAGRLALHICKTMLTTMLSDNQAGFKKIEDLGLKLTKEIQAITRKNNKQNVICQGVNSMFQIFFTDQDEIANYRDFCRSVDRLKFRDFALKLFDKGIYMNPSATLHSLSSIVHNEEDIEVTARAISETLDEMSI